MNIINNSLIVKEDSSTDKKNTISDNSINFSLDKRYV